MIPLDKIPDVDLDDLVADVRSFQNSKAFTMLFDSLRDRYIQQLVNAEVGDLTATSAHASMKVLEGLKNEMDTFAIEQKMRRSNVRHR